MNDNSSVDRSGERIRRLFGEIAIRYDFLNHLLSGGIDTYWRWRAVKAVPLDGERPVLDVCTGTGDLAIAYWKTDVGPSVIGTDFTHEMLRHARQKSARLRLPASAIPETRNRKRPLFVEADTQRLPFTDSQFQVVSVAFGLRNVTNTEQGLREMVRVCHPGGTVVVLEFALPGNRVIRRVYQWYFRHILPKIGQLLARNRQAAYHYLPQSVSQFPRGEDLVDVMCQCGLDQVTWKPLTFGIAALYLGKKRTGGLTATHNTHA